jgi:uncharacterized protein YidB (DUF937 family)
MFTVAQQAVRESGYWAETATWVSTMAVQPVSPEGLKARIDELLAERIQLANKGDVYGVAETMGRLEALGYKE